MDKDTKIELLKIIAMVVILAVLICGIVWLNREESTASNETNVVAEETTNEQTENNSESESETEENTTTEEKDKEKNTEKEEDSEKDNNKEDKQ